MSPIIAQEVPTTLQELKEIASVLQTTVQAQRSEQQKRAEDIKGRLKPLAEAAAGAVRGIQSIVNEYGSTVHQLAAPHRAGWCGGMKRSAGCYFHLDTAIERWHHTTDVTLTALKRVPADIDQIASIDDVGEQRRAITLLTATVDGGCDAPSHLMDVLKYILAYGKIVAQKEVERLHGE